MCNVPNICINTSISQTFKPNSTSTEHYLIAIYKNQNEYSPLEYFLTSYRDLVHASMKLLYKIKCFFNSDIIYY